MKNIDLTLPIVYSLFKGDVHMVLEDGEYFLKSESGLSFPLKSQITHNCKNKKVAYFSYEAAMGHYLKINNDDSYYLYNKDDFISSVNINQDSNLEFFEPVYSSDINSILDYFSYNQVITKTEIAKVRSLIGLKGTYELNWYALSLNNNPQGLVLLVPMSETIVAVAFSVCLNRGVFQLLLAKALENTTYSYIGLLNNKIDNLESQRIPFFHGIYDNQELKNLCNNLKDDEFIIKDLIQSSLFSNIEIENNEVLIKSGNLYYATRNFNVEGLSNCIRLNDESEYVLMEQKSIHPLDSNLKEVGFNEFLKYVKKVHEYSNEKPETDLKYVWGMGGHFYLYYQNDEVIGGGVIQYEAKNHCYVSYIFVLEKYRLKGNGIKLTKAIFALANTISNKKIYIIVLEPKLISFYKKVGLSVVAHVDFT